MDLSDALLVKDLKEVKVSNSSLKKVLDKVVEEYTPDSLLSDFTVSVKENSDNVLEYSLKEDFIEGMQPSKDEKFVDLIVAEFVIDLFK